MSRRNVVCHNSILEGLKLLAIVAVMAVSWRITGLGCVRINCSGGENHMENRKSEKFPW